MMDLPGYKILTLSDINPQIEHLHKFGWDTGKYVGFQCFEKHYNVLAGSCTDWTGYPQSGKTELVLEVLLNMTDFYGHKHLLWVPDIGRAIEVMAKLIHKHTGKTFKKKYQNFIDVQTAFQASAHLIHHFKILYKVDKKARLTPIQLWEFAADYAKEEELNSVMADSWKDFYHDYKAHGGNYAQYLSNILPVRNDIAEVSGLHFHTVIHPKTPVRDKKTRTIYPPSFDDMEGGAQWNNSGKCIIAIHRESFDDNRTDVYFRKIKPEAVGRATSSSVELFLDYPSSRYYEVPEGTLYDTKYFAKSKEKQIERKDENKEPLKQNSDDLPF